MAKTPIQVVSVAAFDPQGRLLMGKRQDCGKWTCPGGHMEEGEKPARAAVRELLEETGLRPGKGGLTYLGSKVLKDGELEVHSFKTTGVDGKPSGEDDPDEECRVWKWLDVEDGLPEEQERNLYNSQDVTLQLLGFQDGPVRKFQIPPPVGERLFKAQKPAPESLVMADQLMEQGFKPTPGFTNKKGLGTNRNKVAIKDPWPEDKKRIASGPNFTEAGYHPRAAAYEAGLNLQEATREAQEDNIVENVTRRSLDSPLAGPLDFHPWTPKEFPEGVYWENPGAAADDVTQIRFMPADPVRGTRAGVRAYSNANPGMFHPHDTPQFQELVRRSRIPREIVAEQLGLKKAWPKDEAENRANQNAHLVTQDLLMEQGRERGVQEVEQLSEAARPGVQSAASANDKTRWGNISEPAFGHSTTGNFESQTPGFASGARANDRNFWREVRNQSTADAFPIPSLSTHMGDLTFRHAWGPSGHYVQVRGPDGGLGTWESADGHFSHGHDGDGNNLVDPQAQEQIDSHLRQFMDKSVAQMNQAVPADIRERMAGLKKTEVDQAQERLRAKKLGLLAPALSMLAGLARHPETPHSDVAKAQLLTQVQELSRDISPPPTPRELAILETQSPSAHLMALQSPAATRADRELVLQTITNSSMEHEDVDGLSELFKHLNRTLDSDQRQWLATQVLDNGRAKWVMATMMEMEPSRWKLPERAIVADLALKGLRSENFSQQTRGSSLRDMVISAHAPLPLAPEQIQAFIESPTDDMSSGQWAQLAAHPDIPDDTLKKHVAWAQDLQKERLQKMADGQDWVAKPHQMADAFMANPKVPDQVLHDYARTEVRNFHGDYGLPPSVYDLAKHRPGVVDQLASELYDSHWRSSPYGSGFSRVEPGGVLYETYIRAANGYDIRPMPPEMQQQISARGVHPDADDLPHFALKALENGKIDPAHREQLIAPERLQEMEHRPGPRINSGQYINQVMETKAEARKSDYEPWLQKMQLHPDSRVQAYALNYGSAGLNPELAKVVREDPDGYGHNIASWLSAHPTRQVPEAVVQALSDTVPVSKAAQTALMSMAHRQNPAIKSHHLQPLLDMEELNSPMGPRAGQVWSAGDPPTKDTQQRHEALSLPQISGDQLFQALTGPNAHRWQGRLGARPEQAFVIDDRPGIEQALEVNGHKLNRQQSLSLVDSPITSIAFHGARNIHPEDIGPLLERSRRVTTLQGILENRGIQPEHLDEIASRPGFAGMLTLASQVPDQKPEVLERIYEHRNRIVAQGGQLQDFIGPLVRNKGASPQLLKALEGDLKNVLTNEPSPDHDPYTRELHRQAVMSGPQLIRGLMEHPRQPLDQALRLGEWVKDLYPDTMPDDWATRAPPHPAFKRQWDTPAHDHPNPDAAISPAEWGKFSAWQRYLQQGHNGEWAKTKGLASRLLDELHPDSRFKTRVKIKPGTERLREIRDLILERNPQGKEISPKMLPPGDWSAGRLPNGNISAEKLQQHIDSLPGQEFNLSHTHWASPLQRHNAFPSKVLQVNLTTEQTQRLKLAGVWNTFKKMAEASRSSSHPVNDHTLGWVRFTGNPKHGFFIDEIQSDLGQSFVKQARAVARDRGIDEDRAAEAAEDEYPEEHYQKIRSILFGNRHPNQLLHEAFLQHLRDKGHTGVPVHMHTPETKAPLSGMNTKDKQGRPVKPPVHMLETYGEQPRKMGYRPVTYGAIQATASRGPMEDAQQDFGPYLAGAAHTRDMPLRSELHSDVLVSPGGEATPEVDYKPVVYPAGATIQGTKIRKFEDKARLWLLTRVEPLRKMAINPKDLRAVGKATNASLGQAQVDDSQEHKAHPAIDDHVAQAFRSQIVDSPEVVKRGQIGDTESSNSSAKAVFDLKGHQLEGLGSDHRFMVKPYHETMNKRTRHWQHAPIQGWAEMTNQALYHAANIGDLHQRVHVQRVPYQKGGELQHGPSLVIHMEPGAQTVDLVGDTREAYSPRQQEQARKIALMDFLSNNLDRHTTNLLVLPQKDQLLAVDHSRSFQYKAGSKGWLPDRRGPKDDELRQYIGWWDDGYQQGSTGLGSILAHTVNDELQTPPEMEALKEKGWGKDAYQVVENHGQVQHVLQGVPGSEAEQARHDYLQWYQKAMDQLEHKGREEWSHAWDPVFQWFADNAEPVKKAFEDRLQLLKEERLREHLRQNFNARWEHLLDLAKHGVDNFGIDDWEKHPVPIFPLERKRRSP